VGSSEFEVVGLGGGSEERRRPPGLPTSLEVAYAELAKRYRSREADLAAAAARAQALAEAGRAFAEPSGSVPALLNHVVERTAVLLEAGVSIFFLGDDRRHLRLVAVAHADLQHQAALQVMFGGVDIPIASSLIGRAVQAGEPYFCPVMTPQVFGEAAWERFREKVGDLLPHSFLALPLWVNGTITGVLSLARDRLTSHVSFSDADRDFALELADRAALAIGHARVLVQLREELEERRKAEASLQVAEEQFRQAQKLEAVGRLAGGVAHDFNNLLSVILTTGQLVMADLPEDNLVRADVAQMVAAAEQATGLTRQLLTFSRKQILESKPVHLNAVVVETERMLKRVIGEDIEIKTVLDPDLGLVKTDPGQIGQVIMNLAVNARDAMPRGGRLTIETSNVSRGEDFVELASPGPSGPQVLLSVTDTGEGMDEETKQHLFEPFFTTKERGKGTGLGLSTVYGIVRQSGGRVLITSERGKGTCVKVFLPLMARSLGAQSAGTPTPMPIPAAASGTVLLVEDDAMVRTVARRILKRGGYLVLEARDVHEAKRLCAEHGAPIDLLLSDLVLPGMNGRELAAALLELHPEMKVVYMSGYTEAAAAQQDFLAPGSFFIEKPFTPETVLTKLREILRR